MNVSSDNTDDQLMDPESKFDFGLYTTRDYIGLGVCGGEMFMKYRDNISYPISSHNYLGSSGDIL